MPPHNTHMTHDDTTCRSRLASVAPVTALLACQVCQGIEVELHAHRLVEAALTNELGLLRHRLAPKVLGITSMPRHNLQCMPCVRRCKSACQ